MQYILSEEEYNELKSRRKITKFESIVDLSKTKLQKLCTKIADELPIDIGYTHFETNEKVIRPWGCIITQNKLGYDHYCDKCPVHDLCPYTWKEHSQ